VKYRNVNVNKFDPKKYKVPYEYDCLDFTIGLKNVKKYSHLLRFMDKIKDISYLKIIWQKRRNRYIAYLQYNGLI
jgi:hypothetical protein